ncbi:AAA family ATPase [Candidatus Dependentiae bacterium]|nr:AAA family ATPase [Candidatus Dependentiae bacterium]
MKKITCGLQNFETVIKENFYYVDKTKYIELLENSNERYHIFLGSCKFGKSLWVVMMDYYYSIRHKDKFDKLFGELYIGKNPTSLRNSYYVLNTLKSGYEIENGYVDIMLWRRYLEITYELMFEIKYLHKKKATENAIQTKLSNAREQIQNYCKAIEFENKPFLRKYALVIVDDAIEIATKIK